MATVIFDTVDATRQMAKALASLFANERQNFIDKAVEQFRIDLDERLGEVSVNVENMLNPITSYGHETNLVIRVTDSKTTPNKRGK